MSPLPSEPDADDRREPPIKTHLCVGGPNEGHRFVEPPQGRAVYRPGGRYVLEDWGGETVYVWEPTPP